MDAVVFLMGFFYHSVDIFVMSYAYSFIVQFQCCIVNLAKGLVFEAIVTDGEETQTWFVFVLDNMWMSHAPWEAAAVASAVIRIYYPIDGCNLRYSFKAFFDQVCLGFVCVWVCNSGTIVQALP